jgi:hypothetical protein
MGVVAFGEAMGYTGVSNTISRRVRRLEAMSKAIPKADQLRASAIELDVATQVVRERR